MRSQIALAQLLAVLRHLLGAFGFACGALGEFAQEFVHRLAQFLISLSISSSLAPFSQRLLQGLLRLAQPLLGGREVAILDLQRHLPEIVGDLAQLVVARRPSSAGCGRS